MTAKTPAENLFTDFAVDYDRMINWPARLAREAPFFQEVFKAGRAAKVLDVACGTGRHAIMFASWGLDVSAIDVSNSMIERARYAAVQSGCSVDFRVKGLEEAGVEYGETFDAITCIGNSLPHIKSQEGLHKALDSLGGALKPGGLLVLQLRNYQRVISRNEKFMPLNSRVENGKEYLYLRTNELGQDLITFNIIVLVKDEAYNWSYRVESEQLKPWVAGDIETCLRKTGFTITEMYGDFASGSYQALDSTDLVIVARKS